MRKLLILLLAIFPLINCKAQEKLKMHYNRS